VVERVGIKVELELRKYDKGGCEEAEDNAIANFVRKLITLYIIRSSALSIDT
jgi:hypothetical protein